MPLLDRRRPAPGVEPLSRPARIAAAALAKRWQLPAATNEVRVLRGVDVPMRDGTVLRADVYLPASAGPHPTVLLRSPYGRGAGVRASSWRCPTPSAATRWCCRACAAPSAPAVSSAPS